jgi:cell division septum initiation protein DivIVA
MVTAVSKNQKTRKVVDQDMEQVVEIPSEAPEEVSDPLAALMSQAQAAYTSYLQAQRKVAEAYQERQRESETSYKEIEENAARICTAALEKAEHACRRLNRKPTRPVRGQKWKLSAFTRTV